MEMNKDKRVKMQKVFRCIFCLAEAAQSDRKDRAQLTQIQHV